MRRCLAFLLFCISTATWATNYYVRTDGNDACTGTTDAGGSSGACAFATPHAGLDAVVCGDTLTIKAGTYTANQSVATCNGGATYTQFGRINGKACTTGNGITVQGERDGGYPAGSMDPNALLTILDGQNTTKGLLSICASDFITVKNLRFQNAAGDPNRNTTGYAPVSFYDLDDFTFQGNAVIDPNVDGQSGGAGEVGLLIGLRFQFLNNYISTSFPIVFDLEGSSGTAMLDTLGGVIDGNYFIRSHHYYGTIPTNIRNVFFRRVRNVTLSNNWIVDQATDAYTQSNQGILLRESTQITVKGNIIQDIQGAVASIRYLGFQDDTAANGSPCCDRPDGFTTFCFAGAGACNTTCTAVLGTNRGCVDSISAPTDCRQTQCNEQDLITGNTFYRSSSTSSPLMFEVKCNGCTVYNNAYIDDVTGCPANELSAMQMIAGNSDLISGAHTVIDRSFFHNIDIPLLATGAGNDCGPGGVCTVKRCDVGGAGDIDASPGGTNFANTTFTPIVSSGAQPIPYFNPTTPASGSSLIDNGNITYCHVTPADGSCDIGAIELSGAPGSTPSTRARALRIRGGIIR